MKNNRLFTIIISALMLFICSATAFAEDITIPETEPSTITEVTDTSAMNNTMPKRNRQNPMPKAPPMKITKVLP